MFGEFRQDLGEVDGADRGTVGNCLHHLIGPGLVLQERQESRGVDHLSRSISHSATAGRLQLFGLGFRSPFSDQLVSQANPRCKVANIPRVRSAAARRFALDFADLVAWVSSSDSGRGWIKPRERPADDPKQSALIISGFSHVMTVYPRERRGSFPSGMKCPGATRPLSPRFSTRRHLHCQVATSCVNCVALGVVAGTRSTRPRLLHGPIVAVGVTVRLFGLLMGERMAARWTELCS